MATVQYQPPDLASVLKTLAQFAPARPSAPSLVEQTLPLTAAQDASLEEGEYEPSDAMILDLQSPHGRSISPPPTTETTRNRMVTSNQMASKRPAAVDPSTIIDWPNALRCVMKTVARSDAIMTRIKKMILVQHEHEKQWWEGRQALLKKQEDRKEGRKKLDDVLRSVGGTVPLDANPTGTEDDANELILYDRKVHRASVEMVRAMSIELKDMGVPFFGTRTYLIDKSKSTVSSVSINGDGGTSPEKTILESELFRLQRKMLDMLEDMCAA